MTSTMNESFLSNYDWFRAVVESEEQLVILCHTSALECLELFPGYGREKMTAGVDIHDSNDILILSMDIDIKQAAGSRLYHYGDASFKGVLPTEVTADKIAAVSDRKVFWRIKDLIGLYALSCCIEPRTDEIYKVIDSKGLQINDFTPFLEQVSGKQGIEYAYNRLNGVEDKPPFETVYARLKAFLMPFIEHDRTARAWNADMAGWEKW